MTSSQIAPPHAEWERAEQIARNASTVALLKQWAAEDAAFRAAQTPQEIARDEHEVIEALMRLQSEEITFRTLEK